MQSRETSRAHEIKSPLIEWVKKISRRIRVELHFTIIWYVLSFNDSYRYEINPIQIMYTANSSILYGKEKTGRILGTWHQ